MQYTFRFRRRSYIASNDCSIFSSYATYYSYLKKTLYAGNVRVLGICILARYLSGLWLVAFLGTVYILLLVKSMRVVLTALIDREVTSLPSPQIHLVPHSQIQHSCHAIWRFAAGHQRYLCSHCRKTWQLQFTYTASQPGTHQKIIDMAMNGVGCRATARIMGVGLNTILRHLKNSGRSR